MSLVDISELKKSEVLQALYNNAHYGENELLDARNEISIEDCEEILEENTYVDYLFGREIMVDFDSDDEIDSYEYDKYYGKGECERIIEELKEEKGII